jgi:hypothetical protein
VRSEARTLLVVLNPRAIPSCLASYEALDVDRAYLTGFYEYQLAQAAMQIPDDYDAYVIVSDDVIVSQEALDVVLRYVDDEHPVVTGYCSLDSGRHKGWVNLSHKPIHDPIPRVENYEFMTYDAVSTAETPLVPTCFVGMALTAMTREIWQRFPFDVCQPYNAQCDYSLSYRLTRAGIPMWAARDGFVEHVKQRWNEPDTDPEKRILIGQVPAEVRMVRRSDSWRLKPLSEALTEVSGCEPP